MYRKFHSNVARQIHTDYKLKFAGVSFSASFASIAVWGHGSKSGEKSPETP